MILATLSIESIGAPALFEWHFWWRNMSNLFRELIMTIERKNDSGSWTEIFTITTDFPGTVDFNPCGTYSFKYLDATPPAGTNQYRFIVSPESHSLMELYERFFSILELRK